MGTAHFQTFASPIENWVEGDLPRDIDTVANEVKACRERGVNMLLDVPPDRHGLIADCHVKALTGIRIKAGI
jgi:hypothetical protein